LNGACFLEHNPHESTEETDMKLMRITPIKLGLIFAALALCVTNVLLEIDLSHALVAPRDFATTFLLYFSYVAAPYAIVTILTRAALERAAAEVFQSVCFLVLLTITVYVMVDRWYKVHSGWVWVEYWPLCLVALLLVSVAYGFWPKRRM
jgi:hypothetical protein